MTIFDGYNLSLKKGIAPSNNLGAYGESLNRDKIDQIGAQWWYVWTNSNTPENVESPIYVPMLIEGEYDSNIPSTYDGHILVFNEPGNYGLGGHPYSPVIAANKYLQRLNDYPDAILIIGNVMQFSQGWVEDFLTECGSLQIPYPEKWGVHAYANYGIETADICDALNYLDAIAKLVNVPIWITECGLRDGNWEHMQSFLKTLARRPYVERMAWYPLQAGSPSFPPTWSEKMGLLEDKANSHLSPMGILFRDLDLDASKYVPVESIEVFSGATFTKNSIHYYDLAPYIPEGAYAIYATIIVNFETSMSNAFIVLGHPNDDYPKWDLVIRGHGEAGEFEDTMGIIHIAEYTSDNKSVKLYVGPGSDITWAMFRIQGYFI